MFKTRSDAWRRIDALAGSVAPLLSGQEREPAPPEIPGGSLGWLRAIFPSYTTHDFAPHHRQFWDWAWDIKSGEQPRPFVAIWPRGGAKSTSAEMLCVAVGARR